MFACKVTFTVTPAARLVLKAAVASSLMPTLGIVTRVSTSWSVPPSATLPTITATAPASWALRTLVVKPQPPRSTKATRPETTGALVRAVHASAGTAATTLPVIPDASSTGPNDAFEAAIVPRPAGEPTRTWTSNG